VNWFGQGIALCYFFAVAALALLYSLRYLILTRSRSLANALTWYLLLLSSLLPAVWLLVVFDWDNEAVAEIANWVGTPIMLFFVPTAFLCYDAWKGTKPTAGGYIARSLLEVVVLIPAWALFWVFCEFLLLGWFGP
jgi:hypothetical protein